MCPSDPSRLKDPNANRKGLVYTSATNSKYPPFVPGSGPGGLTWARTGWSSTNYLANFHAFVSHERSRPAALHHQFATHSLPVRLSGITDGTSHTVFFAEGYAMCDGLGRTALYADRMHNFGVSNVVPGTCQVVVDGQTYTFMFSGVPTTYIPNTILFQVQPSARRSSASQSANSYLDGVATSTLCPAGADCCDNWRAQTPHAAMNIAMGDGAVRQVGKSVDAAVWSGLMLPRDGVTTDDY